MKQGEIKLEKKRPSENWLDQTVVQDCRGGQKGLYHSIGPQSLVQKSLHSSNGFGNGRENRQR